MRIGFIGLGDQGGPIARALCEAGHDVAVWARRAEAAADALAAGARWCDTPGGLATGSDLVALCVTDEAAVRDLLFERSLLAGMKRGAILAIHSTVSPAAVRDLAGRCEEAGIRLLDAPVSGSRIAVAECRLLMLVGGEEAAATALREAYDAFCDPVILTGPGGSATRVKLINNLTCAVNFAIAEEAMALAAGQGLPADRTRLALLAGTGRSFALGAIDRIGREGRAEHVAAILCKDVEIALEAFGDDVPAHWRVLAREGLAALRRAGKAGGGD